MRKEHRPLYIKRALQAVDELYARRYLVPQFDAVGETCTFGSPYHIHVMGDGVELGKCVQISAMRENPVRLAVWALQPGMGHIRIGDFSMINPGARITSGNSITIGRNALFASNVYITDCDWHGKYDRVWDRGEHAPIVIEDNVWLSESVVVCKGVTIGENSIVGARSVVVSDIPANSIAVGNPARVVSQLDPQARFVSRANVFAPGSNFFEDTRKLEEAFFGDNSMKSWLRHLLFPKRGD